MGNKNLFRIPIYLEAGSKDELVKKMLENNLKFDMEFEYFDLQIEGKKWVAWFYAPTNKLGGRIGKAH